MKDQLEDIFTKSEDSNFWRNIGILSKILEYFKETKKNCFYGECWSSQNAKWFFYCAKRTSASESEVSIGRIRRNCYERFEFCNFDVRFVFSDPNNPQISTFKILTL